MTGSDYFALVIITVGLTSIAISVVYPMFAPTWYPRQLQRWGRYRAVGVTFSLLPGLRLREGPEVEVALGQLVMRQTQALYVVVICWLLSDVSVRHGPRLSQSTVNSWAVAGFMVAAALAAALMLRGYLAPYRTEGGSPRPVQAEDYLWPVARACVWCVAAGALLVPVGAVVLARGSSYDAGKVWWEGLVGMPVAGIALVVATELWLRRCADVAERHDPTLLVWDLLRGYAVRLLLATALLVLVEGFQAASAGLRGVALMSGQPPHGTVAFCRVLMLLGAGTLVMLVVQGTGRRVRRRLWSQLTPGERVEFGTALPIP